MDVVVSTHKKDDKHEKHKKSKKSDKKKKRKRSRSSSSESSDRSSLKTKKKKSKKSKKKSKHNEKETSSGTSSSKIKDKAVTKSESEEDYGIPVDLMNTKAKAPERKEEYEKRQSIIRKVYDEETGRLRLIKGDGEVIEEIVTKKAHDEINKNATQSDGSTFQNRLGLNK